MSLETESYSVFGQIDYSLTDDLVLVGGLRYTQEDKDFVGNVYQNENTNDRVIEIDTTTTSLETLVILTIKICGRPSYSWNTVWVIACTMQASIAA